MAISGEERRAYRPSNTGETFTIDKFSRTGHVGVARLGSNKKFDKFLCKKKNGLFKEVERRHRGTQILTSLLNLPVRSPMIGTGSSSFCVPSSFRLKN